MNEGVMCVLVDSVTQELIGPFDDYESAEWYMLFYSHELADGGANLTINPLSEPTAWARENGVLFKEAMSE